MAKKQLTWNEKQARWAKQKRERGFPDWHLWGLLYHLAKHIHPRLVAFRKQHQGYPGTLTESQWNDKLDIMIEAFHLIIKDKEGPFCTDAKKRALADALRDKGLALFGKWYMHLWD